MSNHAWAQNVDEEQVDIQKCRAELEELRTHKKTLEGKIQGYNFLGTRLRQRDKECEELRQKLAEVTQNNQQQTNIRSVSLQNDIDLLTSNKTIQTSLHLLNGYHNTNPSDVHNYQHPVSNLNQVSTNTTDLFGSAPKQLENGNIISDDCLFPPEEKEKPKVHVKMTSNHTTVETNKLFPSETRPAVYGPPADGVRYPPTFVQPERKIFQEVSNRVDSNSSDQTDGPTKGSPGTPRELKSFDIPNKSSLNLMNFEDNILYPPIDVKVDDHAVDHLISIQVRADLATDGPTQNIKKYLEDELLPRIQKVEEENQRKEDQWNIEKSALLEKIRQLEAGQRKNPSPGQSLSENQMSGWNVVQKSEAMNPGDVKLLEDHNKQLVDANRSWQAFYEKTQADQQKTSDYYKDKFAGMTQEINRLKSQDEQKRAEFQKMLFEAKQKQIDEEALKEEVKHYKSKVESLERQLEQIRPGFLQSNMNALHIAGTMGPPEFNIPNGKSLHDLQTENDTLRCQLTVFQEDFDRERSDRAQAQAAKETLREQLEGVKQEMTVVRNQMKQNERQMRIAESNCQDAHREKDKLRQQITELKNTLRREKEANAMHLQRPYQPQYQPIPQHPGYMNHPGAMTNGTPHIEHNRVAAQPQTDPFAQPVPSYLINNHQKSSAPGIPNTPQDFNFTRSGPAHHKEWHCEKCTFSNHPSRTVCEVCGHTQKRNVAGIGAPIYRGYNCDQMEPCESGDLSTDTGDLAHT
ncbi:TNFAIP3-interacting protein 1-like [Argopecten irradians]|uniref:TNFAIP3-interacting protein 1-like n=1 Tax=Argopecten irradians TaxID=31199 RepID=UPI0037215B49